MSKAGGPVKRTEKFGTKRSSYAQTKGEGEWLSSGDTNSKFYHSKLRLRRENNEIVRLKINDTYN